LAGDNHEDTVVTAAAVSKTYRRGTWEVSALHDISFSVPRGSVVAIVGPSGSGKSTLLNILAGLDRPTTGAVEVAGTRLSALDLEAATTFRRRHIGFVFQFFNLLPTMSAWQNVALPLLADRRPRDEVARRVAEALEGVGMVRRGSHRPSELSGGEQQRIAVARALIMRPPLVLADEPTGNLDSATGADVLRLLRRMVQEHGLSIVMVTHSDAAAAAADRVLVIQDGRLVDDRTNSPHEHAEAPAR
jgi:putative ABC transport system ATP-binding protein